jgi:hypothetical protein
LEYWIPAEELADLSENIVGLIDVVAEYRRVPQLSYSPDDRVTLARR